MTVQELMQPRYKVIALWPESEFKGGEILTNYAPGMWGNKDYHFSESQLWFERYPHLFQKLSWWEHREEKDMPEYVKKEGGKVYKVTEWDKREKEHMVWMILQDGGSWAVQRGVMEFFEPATPQDYTDYINKKRTGIDQGV